MHVIEFAITLFVTRNFKRLNDVIILSNHFRLVSRFTLAILPDSLVLCVPVEQQSTEPMGKAVWKKQNKSEQVSLEMSFNLFRGQDFLLNFFQMK